MDAEFLSKSDILRTYKYMKPCFITMSGLPGSGKTYVSRKLSKELQIFLLSNDFVRSYYHQFLMENSPELEKKVRNINQKRLMKLVLTHTPFVFDRDFNYHQEVQLCNLIGAIFQYERIHIKINANDQDNIKRIQQRRESYQTIDPRIIGDNALYSDSFDELKYYRIKNSKPQILEDRCFDYVIENRGTLQQFDEQTTEVIEDIKMRRLIKKY